MYFYEILNFKHFWVQFFHEIKLTHAKPLWFVPFFLISDSWIRMPEFSGKQNPGTENFQTERSRTGKFWDQKIPGIPFFPGIREIFF